MFTYGGEGLNSRRGQLRRYTMRKSHVLSVLARGKVTQYFWVIFLAMLKGKIPQKSHKVKDNSVRITCHFSLPYSGETTSETFQIKFGTIFCTKVFFGTKMILRFYIKFSAKLLRIFSAGSEDAIWMNSGLRLWSLNGLARRLNWWMDQDRRVLIPYIKSPS